MRSHDVSQRSNAFGAVGVEYDQAVAPNGHIGPGLAAPPIAENVRIRRRVREASRD